ncbi:DUF2778 domain-containing protein [Rosenbergiella metrosideri]|uniref:DUF2778 domain-containing protein n=1 Tax=Rosenbergiella metrosideri TaxID=2921185 RepID=UPI001F4F7D29|nr:DUF2778 domain-containing protein [Rosenbergiella metrosideri]
MPWIDQQSAGRFYHNQQLIEQGYSGFPPDVNRADSQHLPNSGPIPIGDYRIGKVTTSPRSSHPRFTSRTPYYYVWPAQLSYSSRQYI